MLDIAVAAEVNLVGDPVLVAADAARDAGNSPNTVMAAAAAVIGPKRVERALACTRALIDLFAHSGLKEGRHEEFDTSHIQVDAATRALFMATRRRGRRPATPRPCWQPSDRGGKSVFIDFCWAGSGGCRATRSWRPSRSPSPGGR
jgi:hypothetical protein